ncbi:MAG: hypothetical protein GY860_20630, partial [Desulfobacteraceae bacterium]|nr:hypothetical protein [Desulfobacteraceae bacterium]
GTTLPSEGACALVLKRLDQAIKDKDRIYGIITGTAGSGGARIPGEIKESEETMLSRRYTDSFDRALKDADTKLSDLSLIDTHSTGTGDQGAAEAMALKQIVSQTKSRAPLNISCAASTIGDTNGVASLFSVIKASLSLYHKILPGSPLPAASRFNGLQGFATPETKQSWQITQEKPRRAAVGSITLDGACAHAVMEEYLPNQDTSQAASFNGAPAPAAPKNQTHLPFKIKTSRPSVTMDMINAIHGTAVKENMTIPRPKIAPLTGTNLFADAANTTARAHEKFLN